MAEIPTIFLSPFLQVFFEKMASAASGKFIDFFQQRKLSVELLMKLETTCLTLNEVLEDAEKLQVTKPVVKKWLDMLKDAVYDAEDVLDEIATEALSSELDAEFQTTRTKVQKYISASSNSFVKEIEPKIKSVLVRLETLAKQTDKLGLREGVGGKSSERLPSTCLVEESDICGRDSDKDEIIKMLLSGDASDNKLGVIAIVGMGGIGKTTLAQVVYNDNRVKEHFTNLEAWVCVSEEFNVFKVTKTILEAVTLPPYDVMDLNQLQLKLKECLTGKKFLIVFDDVWNENVDEWEALCKPFKYGAQGSKFLITTRSNQVVSVARAVSYRLMELPEKDCWSLFEKHAFYDGNSNTHGELEVVGRKIIEKCGRLPLAVKVIGSLLRSTLDVGEWDKILKSELWNFPIDKVPALRLSYKYLSSHLKQCFAYCSIFPKDYSFKKDQLILLWMAEGFLPQPKDKTMEEVGNEYFLNLESRSLFQKSSVNKSCFVMHDLVNDLAKSVSGEFISRLEDGCSHELVNNTRHLSYFLEQQFHGLKKFETLHKAKRLRTFLHLDISSRDWAYYHLSKKVVHDLLPTLRCLRLLSLSKYNNIIELLDSIGKLKHLRYLDLSFTEVQRLPDSICQLCNLQTLRLSHCEKLVALPKNMWKLISLRHLDITGSCIKEMPIHLGRLKSLQTLTKFIVSKGSGSCIGELGKLVNLRGLLAILELQNVESPSDALNASLKDKNHLEELVLEWNVETHVQENQRIVLDGLRPHTNLKSLTIKYYGGKSLSDWIWHPSFAKLAHLRLENCNYCSSLPPLGQLPSLQNLSIVGFDEVVTVDREFCGSGSSSFKPFGALKVLRFEDMKKWEKWICIGDENEGVSFPQLENLDIIYCPKLTGGLPAHLPSLAKLYIYGCQQLVASVSKTPAIHDLSVHHCKEVLFDELPAGMQKLNIERIESLPKGLIDSSGSLQELSIYRFSSLVFLPKDGLPSTLKTLHISHCGSLVSLPEGMIKSNGGLQELVIRSCSALVSLPKDGLPSTLKSLVIDGCMKLELPTNLDYSSLEKLSLWGCDSVKSIPLDLFPNLYHIEILLCSNLESLTVPENYEHDLVTLGIGILFCPNFVSFPKGGLHAPKLTRFSVGRCGSLRSLPDKMHILLPSLEDFQVNDCPKVESFPEGGLPSNLKSILIKGCEKLIASRMGWGLQKLPFLESLSIDSNSEDVESFPEEQLLPTSLTYLCISTFPNLKSLDKKGLQHFNALKRLCIFNCPKLNCIPEQGLPPSLSILSIRNCPLLKKKLQSKKRKEWRKIAHLEQIYIDFKLIE